MFDLGIQELIVIFIVALIIFGPEKLPELARTLGKGIAELRKNIQGVKEQIDSEIENPLKEDFKEIKKTILTDKTERREKGGDG